MLNFPSLTRWIASSSANARSNQEMEGAERGSLFSTLQPKKLLSRLASISLSLVINISKGGFPVCIFLRVKTKLLFLESWITYWGFIEVSPVPHFLMNLPGTVLQGLLEKKCFFCKTPRYFCRIPPAETFAFSLTTLLNDVAAHKPEVVNSCVYLVFHLRCLFQVAERIFEGQVELMASVLAQLQELKRHEGPSPFNTRKSTCKCLVPVLLGTARAMGRFSGSESGGQSSLLGKLYPRPGDHGPVAQAGPVKGFANFR